MLRNFYVRTCVKFPFANKIREAMHERSLVSVTELNLAQLLVSGSALFILPLFYLPDLNSRALNSRALNSRALNSRALTAAGLAQSVERLTAEREVAGSIPGAGPILRVLKITKK